jgi:hypothetical protein
MLSCERQAPVASPSPRGKHPLLDYAFTNELGKPMTLGQLRG